MKTKIVNMTPHELNIVTSSGATVILAPAGVVPRLAVTRESLPGLQTELGEIGVVRPTLGEIENLPAPEEGVVLIVSALVAGAAARRDVMSPGELVRDPAGIVIGCKGLCAY